MFCCIKTTLRAIVVTSVFWQVSNAFAEPGDFWYGLYGVSAQGAYGSGVFDTMGSVYKMNWMYGSINTGSELEEAADNGIRVVNFPSPVVTNEPNLVWNYSKGHFLRYELEGDTTAFCYDPMGNTGVVRNSGGERMADTAASNDSVWVFRKGTHTDGSKVWARHPMFWKIA